MKLKAVSYGSDGFAGDSGNIPSAYWALDATEESTYEELLSAWKEKACLEAGGEKQPDGSWTLKDEDGAPWNVSGEELDEWLREQAGIGDILSENWPVGFWLLTEKDLDTAFVPGDIECWRDSQTYTLNRCMKMLCAHLAVKTVGDPPADDADD
jgi:hypothetical protein